MGKITRTDAFKRFHVTLKNVQWSRSGRTSDGSSVIVALWRDRLKLVDGVITYKHSMDDGWFKSPGQRELRDNLVWSRDKCGGIFKVVVVTAKDTSAIPREVASSDPEMRYDMVLMSLDEESGAFTSKCIWR
jgi:hypothetical protein